MRTPAAAGGPDPRGRRADPWWFPCAAST